MNKKIDKKFYIFIIIVLCFIVGGVLSFESLARFTKKFDSFSKKVTVADFEVKAESEFIQEDTIKPGDTISSDIITLTNNNDYPVEFTISLKSELEQNILENEENGTEIFIDKDGKNLLDYLTLTIDDVEITNSNKTYSTIVHNGDNNVKVVSAKVKWILDESEEVYIDKIKNDIANYTYDIKAKQLDKNGDGSLGSNNGEGGSTDKEDSGNNSDETINKVNFIELKDIEWIANYSPNQSKIVRDISGDLIPVSSYAALENLKFDFSTEKIVFNADIEVLNENKSINNGFNFTLGIKKRNDVTGSNNFTYQIYKDTSSEIYLKIPSDTLDSKADLSQLINSKDIITEKTKLTLSAEIKPDESGKVSCNMTVKDSEKLDDIIFSREVTGVAYTNLDKLYINIGGLASGVEGIKITNLSVNAVDK